MRVNKRIAFVDGTSRRVMSSACCPQFVIISHLEAYRVEGNYIGY